MSERVEVIVTGLTGSGKSAIAGEIEIALKAIGVPVTWENGDSEKRLTHADWQAAIEREQPSAEVRILLGAIEAIAADPVSLVSMSEPAIRGWANAAAQIATDALDDLSVPAAARAALRDGGEA